MKATTDQEKPMAIPVVDCCATCTWMRGWADNAWCGKHEIAVLPYTKCDAFLRRPGMPLWIVCEEVEQP